MEILVSAEFSESGFDLVYRTGDVEKKTTFSAAEETGYDELGIVQLDIFPMQRSVVRTCQYQGPGFRCTNEQYTRFVIDQPPTPGKAEGDMGLIPHPLCGNNPRIREATTGKVYIGCCDDHARIEEFTVEFHNIHYDNSDFDSLFYDTCDVNVMVIRGKATRTILYVLFEQYKRLCGSDDESTDRMEYWHPHISMPTVSYLMPKKICSACGTCKERKSVRLRRAIKKREKENGSAKSKKNG